MNKLAELEKLATLDWTFRGEKAKQGIHVIHSYPAMMPPPLANRLIREMTFPGDTILDPFCGSGTVLAESLLLCRNAVGYDINPLALLIARVKSTPLPPEKLQIAFERIHKRYLSYSEPSYSPSFQNLLYWFKPEVIEKLSTLREAIGSEENLQVKDFYKVMFARTVRQASNTKGSEFKLFRMPAEKLRTHRPDVIGIFTKASLESIAAMRQFYSKICDSTTTVDIQFHDSRQHFPLKDEVVDLMLTSPPYGDSRTTVAYGQFSRLASQWLGLWTKDVDKEGLGGRKSPILCITPSIEDAVDKVRAADKNRADEVDAFYGDLYRSIRNICHAVKPSGFAVFVVANRKVKSVTLPTDKIVVEMMSPLGFTHVNTFNREIPNKRMPSRNSPSNIAGETDVTMQKEYIVVLRKTS